MKWHLKKEWRNSIMTRYYPELGSSSDWLKQVPPPPTSTSAIPFRSTTQICVVTGHENGISVLVSQTSFLGQTSGGVAKWLFSQATQDSFENHCNDHKVKQELIIQQILLISKQIIYIWQTDRRICMLPLRLNLREKLCMEVKKVWILFSVDVDGSYWGTKMFILFTAFQRQWQELWIDARKN